MKEYVVLVDDDNNQVGTMEKLSAHNAHTPLHRAFSCYLFDNDGNFLLTQRALSKKVFPGMWTNSCCGHPGPGEKTEDAIRRRLHDELGLEPVDLLVVLPHFRYRAEMKGIVENEICPVYVARVLAQPRPNPQEVEAYAWISWNEFLQRIKDTPEKYSQWCREQVAQLNKEAILKRYTRKVT